MNMSDEVIKPQFVIEKLYELTGGDAIIVTDVGQHQMWAAQFFKFDTPRNWLSSGGLGTMGYGFPAAIGAKVAHPDKNVFSISGDGSIQMNIQETCHLGGEQHPGEGGDPEQPVPRHGAAVAGAVLPGTLFVRGPGQYAGLCEARRGLRRHRPAR